MIRYVAGPDTPFAPRRRRASWRQVVEGLRLEFNRGSDASTCGVVELSELSSGGRAEPRVHSGSCDPEVAFDLFPGDRRFARFDHFSAGLSGGLNVGEVFGVVDESLEVVSVDHGCNPTAGPVRKTGSMGDARFVHHISKSGPGFGHAHLGHVHSSGRER